MVRRLGLAGCWKLHKNRKTKDRSVLSTSVVLEFSKFCETYGVLRPITSSWDSSWRGFVAVVVQGRQPTRRSTKMVAMVQTVAVSEMDGTGAGNSSAPKAPSLMPLVQLQLLLLCCLLPLLVLVSSICSKRRAVRVVRISEPTISHYLLPSPPPQGLAAA